jgi:hypothetical protein
MTVAPGIQAALHSLPSPPTGNNAVHTRMGDKLQLKGHKVH